MSRPDGDGEGRRQPCGCHSAYIHHHGCTKFAAPAAEADLREQIAQRLTGFERATALVIADRLLALPAMQRLVEQAAEAARLRETVADRYEWAVRAVWDDSEELVERGSEELARVMADYWNGREDGPTCTVLRRTITVGPWEPTP